MSVLTLEVRGAAVPWAGLHGSDPARAQDLAGLILVDMVNPFQLR